MSCSTRRATGAGHQAALVLAFAGEVEQGADDALRAQHLAVDLRQQVVTEVGR